MDASVRYRCFNPAQALSPLQITADVATIDTIPAEAAERYDLLVFHRPLPGKRLEKLINRAAQRRIVALADYDDLIFNPEYAEQSPGFLNRQFLLNSIRTAFTRNRTALLLFDHFSVSTTALAAEVARIKPTAEITVFHNYLSKTWLEYNDRPDRTTPEVKRITYLSGTNSHSHDFALVQELLGKFLSDHPKTMLRIVGPLQYKKDTYRSQQLEHLPWVPFPLLPELIHDSWVTIAPLAGTVFNNCKSGLKYFESAAFGIPVIASPIEDMQRLRSAALHLADTPDQWLKALALLSNTSYYGQCAIAGAAHVKEHCLMSPQVWRTAFAKYL